MRFQHFIAIKSVYSRGVRIAWHYSSEQLDNKKIQTFLSRYEKKHNNLQLGIHRVVTDDDTWDSVVEFDPYFTEVIAIGKETDFLNISNYDKNLKALDIAKAILSFGATTHLKLQKLIYLVYEKALKQKNISIFPERILAWQHGPVVKEVYDEYKSYGKTPIYLSEEDDNELIHTPENRITPIAMRILSAEHGKEILQIIEETVLEYKSFTAWELVELTHTKNSPWHTVNQKKGLNQHISDKIILECN